MIITNLDEYTRARLLDRSKSGTPDRFAKRLDSKDDWKLERVGLLEFLESNDLYLHFKVHNYRVSLKIVDYKLILNKYQAGKFSNDITKVIMKSLNYAIRYNHIQVYCSCPDFKYRFAYLATKNKYGLDTNETRPASKTNPNNAGSICKHLITILNVPSKWLPKVVPAIRSVLKYQDKKGGSD